MADGGGRLKLDFSVTPVGRRLTLCSELLGLKRDAAGLSAESAAKRRHRAHAILRLLLPGELGPGGATDALYSRSAATQLFNEAIEGARNGSAAGKVRAGLLLKDLQRMTLAAIAGESMPLGERATFPMVPEDFIAPDPGSPHKDDSPARPVVDEAKALGALPEGLVDSVKQVVAAHPDKVSWEEVRALAPEKAAEFDAAKAAVNAAWERMKALHFSSDEYREVNAERSVAAEREWELRGELEALGKAELARRRGVVAESVAAYARDMMDSSDVSEEQAQAWANQQVVVTAAAARRLKKQGYAPEQVVKDAAEFYRFSRGRVEKVVIDSVGDRRANATSVDSHGTAGRINLGSTFDKRVLWHELGHHVEADPVAAMAARLFIRLRSVDGKTYSLRSLTKHKGYGAGEIAFKNGFFHPYVGKVYRWGHTEVFSMGIESFSDPYLLATRIAEDPETFEFVTGYLRSPKSALQRLHLAMRQSMRESGEEAKADGEQAAKASIQSSVAKIAGFTESAELPAITDPEMRGVVTRVYGRPVGYFGHGADAGAYYLLLLGRGRHPLTGRMGKAYRFVRMTEGKRFSHARTAIPASEPEIARLFLWYWRQHGIEPQYQSLKSGSITVSEE